MFKIIKEKIKILVHAKVRIVSLYKIIGTHLNKIIYISTYVYVYVHEQKSISFFFDIINKGLRITCKKVFSKPGHMLPFPTNVNIT